MARVNRIAPDLKIYSLDYPDKLSPEYKTPSLIGENKYSVTWMIPRNDTELQIIYTFELYINDEASGMTAIVTVLPKDEEIEYEEITSFWVTPEVLTHEGGTVTFFINVQREAMPSIKTITLPSVMNSATTLYNMMTTSGEVLFSSDINEAGTWLYSDQEGFVNVSVIGIRNFFNTSDGTVFAYNIESPGLYKYTSSPNPKFSPIELEEKVQLIVENSTDGKVYVFTGGPYNNTLQLYQWDNEQLYYIDKIGDEIPEEINVVEVNGILLISTGSGHAHDILALQSTSISVLTIDDKPLFDSNSPYSFFVSSGGKIFTYVGSLSNKIWELHDDIFESVPNTLTLEIDDVFEDSHDNIFIKTSNAISRYTHGEFIDIDNSSGVIDILFDGNDSMFVIANAFSDYYTITQYDNENIDVRWSFPIAGDLLSSEIYISQSGGVYISFSTSTDVYILKQQSTGEFTIIYTETNDNVSWKYFSEKDNIIHLSSDGPCGEFIIENDTCTINSSTPSDYCGIPLIPTMTYWSDDTPIAKIWNDKIPIIELDTHYIAYTVSVNDSYAILYMNPFNKALVINTNK